MTIRDILEQAKALSPQERKELVKLLIDTLDTSEASPKPKTGAEIVATLEQIPPIEDAGGECRPHPLTPSPNSERGNCPARAGLSPFP